jgi:hypothetical protein
MKDKELAKLYGFEEKNWSPESQFHGDIDWYHPSKGVYVYSSSKYKKYYTISADHGVTYREMYTDIIEDVFKEALNLMMSSLEVSIYKAVKIREYEEK